MNKIIRVYDGSMFCPDCNDCPVVDFAPTEKTVTISDSAKPENGKFTMTLDEYNILVRNAKEIK